MIENNADCFAELGDGVFDSEVVKALTDSSKYFSAVIGNILESREEKGRIRHCHGDLHLRNIVLIENTPTLFDGIEFNPDLAEIDVLYDLAFLLMDLDHRQLGSLANLTFNRYLDLTENTAGIACLPLYISVRAAVRAHVSAAMAKQQKSADQKQTLIEEAQAYLKKALSYLEIPAPGLVAIGGLSGSGKSRLAQALAPRLGAVPGARVARSDVLRKRMAGVSIYEKLQAQNYSSEMTQKTYDRVLQECETSLKAGYWAIADAVFARPDQRSAIENVAENMNIPFYGLWLDAPEPVLKSRVDARREDASDADVNVVDQQMGYELGAISWRRINSGESMKKTIESAMLCLNGFSSPAAGKD